MTGGPLLIFRGLPCPADGASGISYAQVCDRDTMLLPLFDIHGLRLFTSHLELAAAAWAAKGPGHERAGGIDCPKVSNEVSHVSASEAYSPIHD
jgi:hypothetical protein